MCNAIRWYRTTGTATKVGVSKLILLDTVMWAWQLLSLSLVCMPYHYTATPYAGVGLLTACPDLCSMKAVLVCLAAPAAALRAPQPHRRFVYDGQRAG